MPSLWAGALLVFYSVPLIESLSWVPVLCRILTFYLCVSITSQAPGLLGPILAFSGKLFHRLMPRLDLSSFSVCYLEISLYSWKVSHECPIILTVFYLAFLNDDNDEGKIFELSYSTILLEVEVTMEIFKNVFM